MKTLKIFLLFFMILYSPPLSYSQNTNPYLKPHDYFQGRYENVKAPFSSSETYAKLPALYENMDISLDPAPQNEPSVKFNAKNPRYVLAAWRDFSQGVSPARRRIGYNYSNDSGNTFFPAQLLIPVLDTNHPLMSDPVVCSDTNGNFYVATISISTYGGMDVFVYKSTDFGMTFTSCSMAAGGISSAPEDKEWMVCDLTKGNSPYKNNLYISWTHFGSTQNIMLVKSTDCGVSWGSPVEVSLPGTVQGSCPAIGPNGEVYVVWVYNYENIISVYFGKSTNGGKSFEKEQLIAQGTRPTIAAATYNSTFPSMAVDVSGGPGNGTIYVTFCDGRNYDADVFLIKSTNGGANWTSPLRINNDSTGNGKQQYWPWIAVNETGKIAIIYYDSRNGTNNNIIQTWLARSTNNGQSFINSVMSDASFNISWPNEEVRFGDYINIDYRGGRILPVWTDLRNGGVDMEIYTAIVRVPVGINNISAEVPNSFILHQNYPNPFNAETNIKFEIPVPGISEMKIYDIKGRKVSVVFNEYTKAGTYGTRFNAANLTSGVYFCVLKSGNSVRTKKMIMIK